MRNAITHASQIERRTIPSWMHRILGIPLERKLLGANLIIMIVAVLMLFGPFRLEPTRLTDAVVVGAALALGCVVNFVLVRVALRPVNSLTHVGWLISEGLLGARVPESLVADPDLTHLSTTINELLDDLVAERARTSASSQGSARSARKGEVYIRRLDPIRLSAARR
jgi:hypothetical protein